MDGLSAQEKTHVFCSSTELLTWTLPSPQNRQMPIC